MPLISVVVPVYKVEKYLERCVSSILAQTVDDFDLVLVDDGSPDNCPDMCDEYQMKDSRIHVIHQENGGLSAARNSGIEWSLKNSDSEWITFIDSDDWVHPKYLESLLNANIKNNTHISMGQVYVTENYVLMNDKDPNSLISLVNVNDAFQREELDPNSACARLYKKNLFNDIRFPVGKLHEDRFTTYKLYFQFDKVSVVDYSLYYYYVNNEGIVHSRWNVGKLDDLEATENQLDFFKSTKNDEVFDYVLKDYIHIMVINLRRLKGTSEFKKYEVLIRKKLKAILMKYQKRLGMSFCKDFNTYKYAYPYKGKVYNRIRSIRSK